MGNKRPQISVVIATRNRPLDAVRAVTSVLKLDYPSFELSVIDQSDSAETSEALRLHRNDSRLTIIGSSAVGLAAARNLGCRSTEAPLIAFTDDDCEVTEGWLDRTAEAFLRNPRVGVVYGNVQAARYDRTAGLVPAYRVGRLHTVWRVEDKTEVEGIGACMALRRDLWRSIGGFDELLGTGAPFGSGEDVDLTVRALMANWAVCEDPAITVLHHGFRPWESAPKLIAGYMYGLGAVYAKMLRIAGLRAVQPTVALAWRWLASKPVVDLNHVPGRRMRLISFVNGYRAGLSVGLDGHGRSIPARAAQTEIISTIVK
ncbi:MAG: glycosyltransferase [Bryobacterales bacterium]|nr:glycosyltransferase [Bryobacterales bacterium]